MLANVNLCETAEVEDHLLSTLITQPDMTTMTTTRIPINNDNNHFEQWPSVQSSSVSSSLEFNSTKITGRSQLNELQKENRTLPPPLPSNLTTL